MLAGLDVPGVGLQLEQLQVQAYGPGSVEVTVRLGASGQR
jgi:hypothetical protein